MLNNNFFLSSSESLHEREHLFHDADTFYNDVFKEMAKAKNSILVEIHFIDNKKLGKKFVKNVLKALDRGVKVQIVADGFSPNSKSISKWINLYKRKGGEIQIFNPLPWRRLTIKGVLKLNQRSHKKVILIDREIAYLGSINIDTRQMSKSFGGEGWREIALRVEGKRVSTIEKGFQEAWNYCLGFLDIKNTKYQLNSSIRLNHSNHWRKRNFEDLINRIQNAHNKIWITNPYFVPDDKMIKALVESHYRGVDVRIIVPLKSDHHFFPLINSIFYRELVKNGVLVYEYTPNILHAKMLIVDDWMILGSSNLNSRTQKHDWEIDSVLVNGETKKELLKRFKRDLNFSNKITYPHLLKKFKGQELYFPFFKAIKYFL